MGAKRGFSTHVSTSRLQSLTLPFSIDHFPNRYPSEKSEKPILGIQRRKTISLNSPEEAYQRAGCYILAIECALPNSHRCQPFLCEPMHGFELAPETVRVLWGPLYFALGLLVALVALASFAHLGHGNISRGLVPASVGLAFVFSAITQLGSDSFLLFVAYEAVMMTFALGIYIACLWCPVERRGAGLLALGVLLTLVAAAVDTQPLT